MQMDLTERFSPTAFDTAYDRKDWQAAARERRQWVIEIATGMVPTNRKTDANELRNVFLTAYSICAGYDYAALGTTKRKDSNLFAREVIKQSGCVA